MAESKQGAKGQKIGRGSRAPTTAMQKSRSERNKRKSLERNPEGAKGINFSAGKSQYFHGQPSRLSRVPSVNALNEAKRARIAAVREANEVDVNSCFRLEFSDKLAEAVAKQRRVSVKDFKAAAKFRAKNHAPRP